ncbi:unnamed protein product [Ostreobium quekettii]|uniref:Uncharacterized protein n=1 Tax=Ostreobium quekettii TaxID=121088 RepID=A0A8S1JE26_9CHLO|nr:unnamed protein product [Ostreobium quekettii]|eukprot:evm.model.scf_515.2 EVM.evm.TU.scf_515.2   scf_515:5274-8776(-)
MAWRRLRPALRGLLPSRLAALTPPGPTTPLPACHPLNPYRHIAGAASLQRAPDDRPRPIGNSVSDPGETSSSGDSRAVEEAFNRDEDRLAAERLRVATREPPVWRYDEDANNAAYLSGVVLSEPQEIPLRGRGLAFCKARLELVLLSGSDRQRTRHARTRVTLWNYMAQQALGHLRRGSMIALRGELEEYGGEVGVVAHEFGMLEDAPVNARAVVESYDGARSARSAGRELRATPSKMACLEMHRRGMGLEEIARARRVLWTTAAGYIAHCAFAGEQVDWGRFCRDIKLGPPEGSFLSVDEIHEVVEAVRRSSNNGSWEKIDVMQVWRELKAHSTAGPKVAAQEQLPRGKSLTLAQIAAVMAMGRSGMTATEWSRLWQEESGQSGITEHVF